MALTITVATTTDPTTDNTITEMLTPDPLGTPVLGFPPGPGFSSGPESASGINRATWAILDIFECKLLLSTL